MKFIYPALIHDDNDGLWVEFPDLDGCFSQGDSLEELLYNARESLSGYILTFLEDGEKLPKPSNIKNLKTSSNIFTSFIEVDVDLTKNTKSVKKTLTIPVWLNKKALEKSINFSQVLQEALIEKIIKM